MEVEGEVELKVEEVRISKWGGGEEEVATGMDADTV